MDKKRYFHMDMFEDLTGDISGPEQRQIEEVGSRIRAIREERGLSLGELSNLTGFPEEMLADIEMDKIQPQLGTVIKLSKALHSAFSRVVSGVGDKLYSVTRAHERRSISRSTSHRGQKQVYTYKSLAPEVKGRHMEAMLVQLEENPDAEKSVHEGEEFIFVLEGVAVLQIADESFDLEPGDSVYYLSTTPHLIAAKSGQATILAVLYEG